MLYWSDHYTSTWQVCRGLGGDLWLAWRREHCQQQPLAEWNLELIETSWTGQPVGGRNSWVHVCIHVVCTVYVNLKLINYTLSFHGKVYGITIICTYMYVVILVHIHICSLRCIATLLLTSLAELPYMSSLGRACWVTILYMPCIYTCICIHHRSMWLLGMQE